MEVNDLDKICLYSESMKDLTKVANDIRHLLIKQGLKTSGLVPLPTINRFYRGLIICDLTKSHDLVKLFPKNPNVKIRVETYEPKR